MKSFDCSLSSPSSFHTLSSIILRLTTKMRLATIFTALYAVTSALSAPVDQANTGIMSTAIDGNFTANVELLNTADAADVVRITYATVDIDHPDKLASTVTCFCWDLYTKSSAFNCF